MRISIFIKILGCLALCVLSLSAGGNKGEKVSISFHIETEASDNPKMIFPHQVQGRQKFFRRIPEISFKDIAAFSPFPADDQASYGLVLQLKSNASRRLAAISQINSGKWLICQAFGKVIDGVLIKDTVEDGLLVIWKNVSADHIKLLDKEIPRMKPAAATHH